MTKLVKIIVLLTAVSASVFSASSHLFFEKVISDGESIVHVNPILDSQNELTGFVYTNASAHTLIIDKFESDTIITIDVPATPFKTILRYSELKDTIFIYTVTIKIWERPQLTLTTCSETSYSQETLTIPTNAFSGMQTFYSTNEIEHIDLKFSQGTDQSIVLIFEYCFRADDYITTHGPTSDNVSTSIIYNLALNEVLYNSSQSNIYPAYLFSTEQVNHITSNLYYHYYNFSDPDTPDAYGTFSSQSLIINDDLEVQNTELQTAYNNIFSVHVGNFAPSSLTGELIIHANSIDLLNNYDSKDHIACYEFSSGSPSEIWYNDDVADIDFSYMYKTKDLLVGTDRDNNVLMLNYLNGAITDSAEIEADLRNTLFYETGNEVSLLNFVGMSGDTVKSYRFDISTDIHEQGASEELPNTFELFQNHPNPFNSETRLEFSTTENQYLKLSIFNILGQEIKTLAASRFSPGQYFFYWNGSDENGLSQSTGIYFAQLESATTSDLIKLIYLK